ncbi:transcriptional regulator (transcriptional regulator, lysr family) [Agrilactobacillus composti DSM 18527 = JCM 14202]|uniref:Transcriptional regulator (Transcriptional regulator, lysr family) n=1 Tax=Agrilactobacillus composti DSM 18527 = JCM 14202 TaxID=1423734 RepID=X0PS08_9LACO|nr:LysR family transcriptional regulator [Agrilactobacillus composti]KRM32849.1 transcriptional regulator (transcriptional regulator, lysr family) [Agrilactobacillus composti DSM 18527 = JCM 14202]GAF40657.1 transcriptional regulator, LysR family [Agrilactobacillus composti DSM 18527 = JCM 14202]
MNLNQLRYFRVLVEEKQYTKAASKLFISQPSLSNSMKSFEEELNGKLFRKEGRQIILTNYGKMIYKTVCDALDTLDQGINAANEQFSRQENTIRVAWLPTTFGTMLPRIIQDFKKDFDETIHFMLFSKASIPILDGLRDEKYDIGISSYMKGYSELEFTPFYTEDIIVLTPKSHPFTKYHRIKLNQLAHERLITYTPDIPIGATIQEEVTSQIKADSVDDTSIDEVGIAGLVASGQGIGVCADTSFLAPFDLVKIPLDIPSNTRVVYIVRNKNQLQSKFSQDFFEFISAYNLKKIGQLT